MLFKKFMPLLAVAGLMFSNAHALRLGAFIIAESVQNNVDDANALLQCIEKICADNACSNACADSTSGDALSQCLSTLLAPCNTSY